MVRGCAIRFGIEMADRIQAMVEEATGQPCPCRLGEACPILPPGGPVPVDLLPIGQTA